MQSVKSRLALWASIPALVTCATVEAHAAAVTFVSPGGNNNNACTTVALPCAQVGGGTGALSKTDEGGVIHVLPGDYNAFSVDKSVEIVVDGGRASMTGTAIGTGADTAQIVVNAGPTDDVHIRGFLIDGAAVGSIGVLFLAGGALHLEDCTFVNAGFFAVVFAPTAVSELYVSNSTISRNSVLDTHGGIQIKPTGSGGAKVVLDNVNLENNTAGILIDGRVATGSNTVVIGNTNVVGSGTFGIFAADSGGGTTNVTVDASTSANNGTFGIGASGANATVRVRNSIVTGNGTGLQIASSGKIVSLGGNAVSGNTTNGAFTSTVVPQ